MNEVKKFIILTTQRSGSVFLEQCLNSHSSIKCFGEILLGIGGLSDLEAPKALNRFRRARLLWTYILSGAAFSPQNVIADAFSRADEHRNVVGFRCMYNQLQSDRAIKYLLRQPDIKVIHLRRANLLLQYISRTQMHDRQAKLGKGSAHTTKEVHVHRVHISPNKAIKAMRQIVRDGERLDSMFSDHRKLNANYEDMIHDGGLKQSVSNEFCEFLGVEQIQLNASLKKMNRQSLRDSVTNYEELRDALTTTEFSGFLEIPEHV